MQSGARGFTIIELLVVIVIIGILIALALPMLFGAQMRARNTQTRANVREFYLAIKSFHVLTGAYPMVSDPEDSNAVNMVCLGIGYPGGTCGVITGTTAHESPYLYEQFDDRQVGVPRKIVNNAHGAVGNENFTGAAYGIDTVNFDQHGVGMGRVIEWFLEGEDVECGVDTAYSYNTDSGNTACELFLEPL